MSGMHFKLRLGNARRWTRNILFETYLSACVFAAVGAAAADTNIIAEGTTVQKLADGFSFTEGPASDAQGNVFFTDQPNDRILEWSIEGKLSTFMQPCGRANGLSFDQKGNLWACADEKNEMWRIGPGTNVTVVIKEYQGNLLN